MATSTSTASASETDDWQARWRLESACSAKELAKLCCGWNPSSDELPDPRAYNRAMDAVLRAVLIGDLKAVDLRVPASREEFFYGEAPFVRMSDAIAWAAPRFSAFPFSVSSETSPESLQPMLDRPTQRERILCAGSFSGPRLKTARGLCDQSCALWLLRRPAESAFTVAREAVGVLLRLFVVSRSRPAGVRQ
jgi:hypothetical protein